MKLSMIHSISRGRNQLQLDESNLKEAMNTLFEVEKKMGLVFQGVGRSNIADIVHQANTFLLNSKTNMITISQFMKQFENDLDKFTLDRVISTLEVCRIIKVIHKPGCEDTLLITARDNPQ
jgi:hypothetical protein